LAGDNLRWASAAAGEWTVPLQAIESSIRPGATPARDEPKAQDLVIFANGDRLEGIVSAVTPEELTVMVGTATQSVALSSVVEIKLATIGDAPKPETPAKFEVRLTDGSVMST